MDCEVCSPVGDVWMRLIGGGDGVGGGGGGGGVGNTGGFSHESEHDLALMVSDFLENNGSSGADSWCSSDSDSGFSDLSDNISFYKHSLDQYESDLLSVVHSLLRSTSEAELHAIKSSPCGASCIRYYLVKLLRHSGYDAAVCTTKWQGSGKVPGGDHEFIDVVNYNGKGTSDRLIIDIDFRSHFEIARAVKFYDRILNSLPVVFVGSLVKLQLFLPGMVEAARSSLKQNSMPLPPWRSLAYLQSKWQSPHERRFRPDEDYGNKSSSHGHEQCRGHLKRLQSSLQSGIEEERLLKPISSVSNRKVKLDRRRCSSFINL